jgi:hypothetical protein
MAGRVKPYRLVSSWVALQCLNHLKLGCLIIASIQDGHTIYWRPGQVRLT